MASKDRPAGADGLGKDDVARKAWRQRHLAAELDERRKQVGESLAATAGDIAATEGRIAKTLDAVARNRPDRAAHLHELAEHARAQEHIETSNAERRHERARSDCPEQ
ncbi:hypothetical protein [Geodermatophilus telluris]|uniref:hypothetical protein n=1 Tax=Geodermatophilus telluris TaxID=1190417 RepID=UPI000B835A88|nr:hypothetical protein [Geodermatophilus telluris]